MRRIPNTHRMTILAQDPAVRDSQGCLVLESVDVPLEALAEGPTGYRVKVVDFDASTNSLYNAITYKRSKDGAIRDPFARAASRTVKVRESHDRRVLGDPNFHAQNAYAIVMRTLARFEFALGRRVAWGFGGHQLHVVPHAFQDANAYYSEPDRALMFGYFEGRDGHPVFTCLSHDIVAHEATHAILDGLRNRYTEPSGPDQAAFHEGFADVVALLSVFSLKSIVELAITGGQAPKVVQGVRVVSAEQLQPESLARSILFGLGKQFGQQLEGVRANALRRSVTLTPDPGLLDHPDYLDPHARGEVFAAAMLRSFLGLWTARIRALNPFGQRRYSLDEVVAEGAKVAGHLLTMSIRALDYCPPLDLAFGDYVAALLTIDAEVAPDDSRYDYRKVLIDTFAAFGICPPPDLTGPDGCWRAFDGHDRIVYHRSNFESMLRDEVEVFRFIWENRSVLGVDERGYTEVISVRPSVRQGPEGFFLRETICEYIQIAEMFAAEVEKVLGVRRPEGMNSRQRVTAYGGGVLIFDQFGRIKYHVARRLGEAGRQQARLDYLWENGYLERHGEQANPFAEIHRLRAEFDTDAVPVAASREA